MLDTVRKQTINPIRETNKEHTDILKQKKMGLENDVSDTTTRENPYLNSYIYLTSVKVSKLRMVDENRREKKARKGTAKKTSTKKDCILKTELFQKFQHCMDNIFSPYK